MKDSEFIEKVIKKVTESNHLEAIDLLILRRDLLGNLENDIYIIKARFTAFCKSLKHGTLSNEEIILTTNKLSHSILQVVNEIKYELNNKRTSSSCEIPVNYMLPQIEYREVVSFLNENQNGFIVISGLSGAGKSVFSSYLYNKFYIETINKQWLNCGFSISNEKIKEILNRDIVVFDNYVSNNERINKEYFKYYESGFVFTTTSDPVASQKIESFARFSKISFLEVNLGNFTGDDSYNFLREIVPLEYLSNEYLMILAKNIAPLPILWQIAVDVIQNKISSTFEETLSIQFFEDDIESELHTSNLDSEKGIGNISNKIVDSWFESKDISDQEKEIIWILSNVPMIGMSPAAMNFVLQGINGVKKSLLRLTKIGLIKIFSNRQIQNEQIIQVHELFKNKEILQYFSLDTYRERYFDYLEMQRNRTNVDLATKIDVLVLKIKGGFEKYFENENNYVLDEELSKHFKLLEKTIPTNSNSHIKSEWIANIFKPLINKESTCSVMIGLGQSISYLAPNRILGDTIWEGRHCDDGWARGCCINASIGHWENIPMEQKEKRKNDLIFWFEKELWQVSSIEYARVDLDVAAFLAGLCRLGYKNYAINIVQTTNFQNKFPITITSLLALLVYLIDEKDRKFEMLAVKYWHLIYNSSAKSHVVEYSKIKGFDFGLRYNHIAIKDEKHFGQSIGKMVNSNSFIRFCKSKNEDISYI